MPNKVLIVEDSTLQAKMHRMLFGAYPGCQTIFALNGLEALDQLDLEKGIDLILLDINMPKMNGLAFLETMRRNGYGQVPVIVISTEGKDEDIRRALELGAKAYIKKPWKPDHVRELIARIMPGSQP
jgi:two-component system, chemotaxis family, chemotaxis protein CheY